MNDKIVINTISNIYIVIVSFLSFIFLALSLIFIVLQNGIYIDKISTPDIKIKQLYIKWNEKIDVSIKDIKITSSKSTNSDIDHKKINKIFNNISIFRHWIEKLTIENIDYNNINASFNYDYGDGGSLTASSDDFILKSFLYFKSEQLVININKFTDTKHKTDIRGDISIDNSLNIFSSLNATINNEIFLTINAFSNRDKLLYKLKSDKNIKSIKYLVDMINPPKAIRFWIIDAIDMSHLTINNAYGWIDYDNIEDAYKNIYASASLKKLNYTYNTKLDSIHTAKTELEFKNGTLFIYPKNPYSYNQNLGKSWLKIDFTQEEELLTLHLLFEGILNKDILHILNTYKIKIPFLQKKGTVKSDLILKVGLRTIAIDAQGNFFVKKGNFDYLGLNIDIQKANIVLDNYDVKVDNMLAQYENIASSKVDIRYNAKRSVGKVNFAVKSIKFEDINLFSTSKSLNIVYNIYPNKDNIEVEKSDWKLANNKISVEKLKLPFSLDDLVITVPKTLVQIEEDSLLYASGDVFLKTLTAKIDINLTKLLYKNISLKQTSARLKLTYDENLTIDMPEETLFLVGETQYSTKQTSLLLDKTNVNFSSSLNIQNVGSGKLNLNYSAKENTGEASVSNLEIKNDTFGNIFSKDKKMLFNIKYLQNILRVHSKELDIDFTYTDDIWALNFNSINKLYDNSELMKQYKLTNGTIALNKHSNNKYINFSAYTKYPHKIIVVDNIPTSDFKINGKIDTTKNTTNIKINNIIDINIDEKVKISTQNIGLDVDEVIKALDNNNSSKKDNSLKLYLNAKNCFLYITENRRVISQEINLKYLNNKLTAQLIHKKGNAGFEFFNNKFQLYGENFNDKFMEELFALSKFKDGAFNFSMYGTPQEYTGVFELNNTIIKSYKVLNNVLAFVNTIPALVTFSLPGYHKHGLEVNNAYMNFTSKNNDLNISSFYMDSKELDILGQGTANFKKDKVDFKLNLKTDLASAASKVPVVGYIIFNDDSISTAFSIKGKLSDPKVKSLIAKEIVVAPLNIIKRTLLYPYYLLSKIQDANGSQYEEEEDEINILIHSSEQ